MWLGEEPLAGVAVRGVWNVVGSGDGCGRAVLVRVVSECGLVVACNVGMAVSCDYGGGI